MAILNARWLGYEQEAYDFEDWDDEVNFVDYDDRTSEAEWNMLAYYFADPDLGFIGIGYDVFAPQDNITNKQLAKILLVAMGYPYGVDYDWNDILAFAADIGINLGSSERGITNSELADAMVAALESFTAYTDDDDNDLTFAQYLLGLGIVTEEDLIEAGINYKGLVPGAPGEEEELPELLVENAIANNFAEVELTFNQKVDPESVDWAIAKIDNLAVSSDAKIYVVSDFGDGKVVRIFEPDSGFVGAQNESRTISLTGLRTPGGITMTAYSGLITFRDSTAPFIEKVVAKGNTRLDIHFSEPIMNSSAVTTLANYQVGGKALSASKPTLNDDADENTNRIVTIKSIKTSLSPGVYVLGITGENFRDFANNTLGYQTAEFEIIANTEGPIAQKVLDPIYQYKVSIEFDNEIQDDAKIRWVDGSKTHTSDKTTVKDNVATFEFTSAAKVIPMGGTTITLVDAKDYWNNPAQAPLSFDIVPVADTLRPAVVSYGSDGEGELWIRFNKALDTGSVGSTPSKWLIKRGDDTTYAWKVDFKDDDKKIVLSSTGSDTMKPGLYKLTIRDVKDTVLPTANTIVETTIEIDVPDTVAPSIVKAEWSRLSNGNDDRSIINIFFSKEVDYSSAVTRANYRTTDPNGNSYKALPNTAKVELLAGNRTVRLTFASAFALGTVMVSAIDVQDLYGNRSNSYMPVVQKDTATVTEIKATGVSKVEVKFTTALTTYTEEEFTLVNGIASSTLLTGIAVDAVDLSDDGLKATLTLSEDLSGNAKFKNNDVFLRINNQDVVQNPISTEWYVEDDIEPEVLDDSFWDSSDDYSFGGDPYSLYIIFSEPVQPQGTSWNAVFKYIQFGSDRIENGVTKKDDYTVSWTVGALTQAGSDVNGKYYIRLQFFAITGESVIIKDKNITIPYGYVGSPVIEDSHGIELDGGAFNDIVFSNVRVGV